MSNLQVAKLPIWFWIIAGVALIWNLMGVSAYIMQVTMSAEILSSLPEAERALYENVPVWATGAFALAVFGGAIGCVLLLLRRNLSVPVFGASFAGVIVQMIYNFGIANSIAVYGPGSMLMPVMVVIIGAFLIWYSMSAKGKGWLK